ncbi:MAG: DUF2281 domain-containing protein [Rhodoferax sp.]|nr:DUF2281 domain-containing protein [Rhodoferax sp.]
MNATQKLYEVIKDFSDPVLAEVIDYAEFLRHKQQRDAPVIEVDEPLLTLAGGLETSETFKLHSLLIQARMRDEWN